MSEPTRYRQLKDELRDLHELQPARFLVDLTVTATLGWGTFALAVGAPPLAGLEGVWTPLWALLSALFLYRALSFIHEVAHFRRQVPGLHVAYNLLVGFPLRVPAYAMLTHRYHHGVATFASKADPEYELWTERPAWQLLRPLVLSFLYPLLLLVRSGIWPILLLALPEKLRMATYLRASSFVMNLGFERPFAREDYERVYREDLYSAAVSLAFFGLLASTRVFVVAVLTLYAELVLISILNTYRALVAHRYAARPLDSQPAWEQMADAVTVEGWAASIWAPLNLQYHSAHHLLPGIPYHHLAAAHRRLQRLLPESDAYHRSVEPGFWTALIKLARSCGQTPRRASAASASAPADG